MRIVWIEERALAAGGIPVGEGDIRSLADRGVEAIVSLTEHPLTSYGKDVSATLDDLDISYLHVPIVDQYAPKKSQASQVAQFINRMKAEGHPVYIHCHAGIGRTGTMLHAYYLIEGLDLHDAMARVKKAKASSQFLMLSAVQQQFLHDFAKDFNNNTAQSILESAYLRVIAGRESEFEVAFKQASKIIASMNGYISHELHKCIETPSLYLLLVRWETLEDHTVGFRESDAYQDWKALLHHFYEPFPTVEHFKQISLED